MHIISKTNVRKVRVSFHHVEIDGDKMPALCLSRKTSGKQNRVIIPINMAHVFCSSSDNVCGLSIMERTRAYCDVLYGDGMWVKDEQKALGDLILSNLDSLLMMPPEVTTAQQVEKAIEQAGLKLTVNDKTVIDAS